MAGGGGGGGGYAGLCIYLYSTAKCCFFRDPEEGGGLYFTLAVFVN